MFDCADDILAYHDDEVTLPQSERTAMRDRRNANRDRVKNGLKDAGKPKPIEFKGQGSYAMKTMTQHPENNYDIDDGVYFEATDLVGAKGGEMSPLDARQMVRDAVDDGSFKTKPEVRKNCVRVVYDAGYPSSPSSKTRTNACRKCRCSGVGSSAKGLIVTPCCRRPSSK
jgi:hypothetical protein